MHKLDLHTHSVASPDGGLTIEQYRRAINSGILDYIAVTDHNRIDFAWHLNKKLGSRIIVGEEIMTNLGEIIGLFLTRPVNAGLTPAQTVKEIKKQGGLVYIPHPFETFRKGLSEKTIEEIADSVDIVETYNGRALFQNRTKLAHAWAKKHNKLIAASSDAHGWRGLGFTYTEISDLPNNSNLLKLLEKAELTTRKPSTRAILYPKYNRFRNKLMRKKILV